MHTLIDTQTHTQLSELQKQGTAERTVKTKNYPVVRSLLSSFFLYFSALHGRGPLGYWETVFSYNMQHSVIAQPPCPTCCPFLCLSRSLYYRMLLLWLRADSGEYWSWWDVCVCVCLHRGNECVGYGWDGQLRACIRVFSGYCASGHARYWFYTCPECQSAYAYTTAPLHTHTHTHRPKVDPTLKQV